MKKFLSIFCASLFFGMMLLPFVACSEVEESATSEITELRFDIRVTNASEPATKVVKTSWENGDKIFIFFKKTAPTEEYLNNLYYATLTYNSGTGKWDGAFSEGSSHVEKIGTAGIMYAIYFPFANVQRETGGWFYSSGQTNGALNGKFVYSFYMTNGAGSSYTLTKSDDIATLSGDLSLVLPSDMVYFYVSAKDGKFNENEKYRLSVAGVKPATVTEWENGVFEPSVLGPGQPMWGYKYGDGIAFAGLIDDSWATAGDHKCYFFSDGDPATTKTLKNKTLTGHATVNLDVTSGWTRAIPDVDYTKMCDGNYWGNWNLGCEDIDDDTYGLTFRWGEIVPNGTGGYFPLSMISTNPLVGGYAVYDAARALLGANWRMPTKAEMEYLIADSGNCTNEYKSASAGLGGKRGWLCTGKTEPKNSIYFRTDNSKDGVYWTATSPNSSYAISCRFTNSWFASFENSDRTALKAIRPIYCGPVSD